MLVQRCRAPVRLTPSIAKLVAKALCRQAEPQQITVCCCLPTLNETATADSKLCPPCMAALPRFSRGLYGYHHLLQLWQFKQLTADCRPFQASQTLLLPWACRSSLEPQRRSMTSQ